MLVLLSYSIFKLVSKQPRKCQLYHPFCQKITIFLIFSNAVRDIGNIFAASDRHCETLQLGFNECLLINYIVKERQTLSTSRNFFPRNQVLLNNSKYMRF